jgi:hypothetical protein
LQGQGCSKRQAAKQLGVPYSSLCDILNAYSAAKPQVDHSNGASAKVVSGGGSADRMNLTGTLGTTRQPRTRPIRGAEGYVISEQGIAWKNGQRVLPEEIGQWRANKHKNGHKFATRPQLAMYLGGDYCGPIPAIGGARPKSWRSTPPVAPEMAPWRERELRMLDEVVAGEFVAVDPYMHLYAVDHGMELSLRHLDGDPLNCEARNLQWVLPYSASPKRLRTVSVMRHHKVPAASRQASRDPRWTGARNLPGHTPTSSSREK